MLSTPAEPIESSKLVNFAICLRKAGELVGSIGLVIHAANERAEMRYWVGKPF